MDDFDDLYDEWVDEINSYPLTTTRIYNYRRAITMNQQIVNNLYNIRRYLELNDLENNDVTFRNNGIGTEYDIAVDSVPIDPISHFESTINPNTLDNLFMLFLQQNNYMDPNADLYEDVKVTLTEEQFKKFKETTIDDSNINLYNTSCNICMEEYKGSDIVTTLHCKHVFHKSCIHDWLCKERVTCPICRKDNRIDFSVTESTESV